MRAMMIWGAYIIAFISEEDYIYVLVVVTKLNKNRLEILIFNNGIQQISHNSRAKLFQTRNLPIQISIIAG